jgi:hypothetical protein
MGHTMSRLISMLVTLVVFAFPVIGYSQSDIPHNREWFNFSMPVSQSTGETIELLVAIGDIPGNAEKSDTFFFTHSFSFQSAGPVFPDNAVEVDAPVGGLAKFTIAVGNANDSEEANLIVNGEEFCCFDVNNNRVVYRVDLRRSKKGIDPSTGRVVTIPPSTPVSISETIFDTTTGETRSSDQWVLRPVIKVDRNWN